MCITPSTLVANTFFHVSSFMSSGVQFSPRMAAFAITMSSLGCRLSVCTGRGGGGFRV